jgi:molybdopterin-guanine dinucleotide biosynthesis protein A
MQGTRFAGSVLVGGRSRRMGRDKALLTIGDRYLVQHVADTVAGAAGSVVLVGDSARYGELGYPVIADRYPDFGPVGGIATALAASSPNGSLVVACDMPAVTVDVLKILLELASIGDSDCVVPLTPDGAEHPLCAVYAHSALGQFEAAVLEDVRTVKHVLKRLRVQTVRMQGSTWARNVNTPADWTEFHASR